MNRDEKHARKPSPRENFSEKRMYYEKLADKYHILQYIFAILTAIFVAAMIFFGYRSMMGDHFRYLFKTLSMNPVSLDGKYHDISYAAGSGVNFALYKDDLAVIGDGKAVVYDLSGDLRFRESAKSTATAYAASEKYMAVYTPGSKGVSVYNSFGCVYETNFKYPVRSVCLADGGTMAVSLKKEENTVVCVLGASFETQAEFTVEDGVLYDMDLSQNGDKLILTVLATSGGAYYTKLLVCDVSEEEIVLEEKLDDKKPISTGFFDDGRFYAAVEGNVFFYQSNGKMVDFITVPASEYSVSCDGAALVVLEKGNAEVAVYSPKGDLRTQFSLSEKVFSLKVGNGCYYTLSESDLAVYNENGEWLCAMPIRSGAVDFFVLSDDSLLLCFVSGTERIVPSY